MVFNKTTGRGPIILLLVLVIGSSCHVFAESHLRTNNGAPSPSEGESEIHDFLENLLEPWMEDVRNSDVEGTEDWRQLLHQVEPDMLNHAMEEFGSALFSSSEDESRRRSLQEPAPCNTVLHTLSLEQVKNLATERIDGVLPGPVAFFVNFFLKTAVLNTKLIHGVKIWKVCGKCSDFGPLKGKGVSCRSEDYGYEALQSGLLIAPLDETMKIVPQARPINIQIPAGVVVPSLEGLSHFQVLVGIFSTSMSGFHTIMPDKFGYGESSAYIRSMLIRQPVVTSIIPLIWQAQQMIPDESSCMAATANAFTCTGYSEAGNDVVTVADALHQMGHEIIALNTGGAPMRLSSTVLRHYIQNVQEDGGDSNDPVRFALWRFAGSLSTTVENVANFNQSQNMLVDDIERERFVMADKEPYTHYRDIFDWAMRELVPEKKNDLLNRDLVEAVEGAVARGEDEPCVTSVNDKIDSLCQALRDQDVYHVVEQATYPVAVCHSKQDNHIAYENIPDASLNPNVEEFGTLGPHGVAIGPCVFHILRRLSDWGEDESLLYPAIGSDACSTVQVGRNDGKR